jgi:hypothetical protein
MTTAVQNRAETQVARSLRVLAPLIAEDIKRGEEAGLPSFQAAGAKLIEAQASWTGSREEFYADAGKRLGRSRKQLMLYIRFAKATGDSESSPRYASLHEFRKEREGARQTVYPQAWHEPVKETLGKVSVERQSASPAKPTDERTLRNELALQLIDIGYKALATKLHPDKGGSREAMTRLNQVRQMLKGLVR